MNPLLASPFPVGERGRIAILKNYHILEFAKIFPGDHLRRRLPWRMQTVDPVISAKQDFCKNLKAGPRDLSTVNLHIRVLYVFFYTFEYSIDNFGKKPCFGYTRIKTGLSISSGTMSTVKDPVSSCQKFCSIYCGDNKISDFRRTSILRKPLLIREKIE